MSPFISLRFLQSQTDARLLTLAAEGHERAFEALVRRHRRALLSYSRRLLGSSLRAEDAVQQALLQAWIALQHGTEVRDAKSWFYRIVRNTALNMQRGAAGQEFAELTEASKVNGAGDIDGWMAIKDIFTELAALPPLQRQALLRTSLEGESHDEVASALGVTTKAVRGLVYRARATMRAAVSALIPPPLVQWALSGKSGVGGSDRIAEIVAGGGGIGAIALNSGAAMVTVGALAAGAAVAPHGQGVRTQRHSHAHVAAAAVTGGPSSGAGPAVGSGSIVFAGATNARHDASASGGPVGVTKRGVDTRGGGGSSGSGGQGSGGRGGPGGGPAFGGGPGRHDGSGSGSGDGSGSRTGSSSGSGDGSGSGQGDSRPGSGGSGSSGSGSDGHGSTSGGGGHDGTSGSGDGGGGGSGSSGGGGDGGSSGPSGPGTAA